METQSESLLQSLGYAFDINGSLINIKTGWPFVSRSLQEYDIMSQAVIQHVQSILKTEYGMEEIFVKEGGPDCNIFVSKDLYENQQTCLLLIHGMGNVKPGV